MALSAGPRLRLIRHGQASLGAQDYDRLSALGLTQARLLGARLGRDGSATTQDEPLVVTGSMRRHRQTLNCLGMKGRSRVDQSLNEFTVNELIKSAVAQARCLGLKVPDSRIFEDPVAHLQALLDWFPEVLDVWQQGRLTCPHNGTWQSFRQRVLAPVEGWRVALEGGRDVLVVTSAGVISAVAAELLGRSLAWQRELNVTLYNSAITELILGDDGQWCARRINCIRHLERPELHTLA